MSRLDTISALYIGPIPIDKIYYGPDAVWDDILSVTTPTPTPSVTSSATLSSGVVYYRHRALSNKK